MKRTSVRLPDEVVARLRHESRRRRTSVAEIVREAIERHLPAPRKGEPLTFFAIGEGEPPDASERVDDYVDAAMRKRKSLGG